MASLAQQVCYAAAKAVVAVVIAAASKKVVDSIASHVSVNISVH